MAQYTATKSPKPIEINKFLGINESVGDTEIKLGEALSMINFRITPNYKLEKRGGHTTFIDEVQPTKPIQGMWYGKILNDMVLIYACNGNVKKKVMPSGSTTTLGTMTDAKTKMFYFTGKLFFQNGVEYKYYDGTTFADVSTIAYVPTLSTGAPPAGGGTILDEINNLTPKKKQLFVGDGTSALYQLLESSLDAALLIIKVNGVTKTETVDFAVNRTLGQVTFTVAPPNLSEVSIQWEKAASTTPSLVLANRSSDIFGPGNGTTVFMFGNTSAKNRRTFSYPLDATYFPVSNFTLIGSDEYEITDIQPQYDRQIVFKENQAYYSLAEINPSTGLYIYPVYDLNYSIGNVCFDGVQVVRNNPISLYGRTVWEWSNTYVKDERNANDKGDRMPKSFDTIDFKQSVTFDFQKDQELWINVGSNVYIWNYENDTWYIYDNIEANCFLEIDNVLYYGSKDGKIERFEGKLNDNDISINAEWRGGFTDFGAYEFLKNSRDMWINLQPASRSSLTIKCPTNRKNSDDPSIKTFTVRYNVFDFETIDFEDFSFETNRNPQTFRVKIKAKKYAYIQFIFSNNEDDETVVLNSFKVTCETNSFVK